ACRFVNGCFRKEFNVNQTVLVVLQPLKMNCTVLLVVMQLKRFREKREIGRQWSNMYGMHKGM
ncbi:hypothetical protein A2U01_0117480, partial [Trifolium medium]|nr:hypothetical protein [Trifolium medium]